MNSQKAFKIFKVSVGLKIPAKDMEFNIAGFKSILNLIENTNRGLSFLISWGNNKFGGMPK